MKVFFDTEFTGLHQSTTLISIGCIADNGQTFYAECTDYDQGQVNNWLRENVISHLVFGPHNTAYPVGITKPADECVKAPAGQIGQHLKDWLYDLIDKSGLPHDAKLEMWSDCLAYDWVLFCQLFGGAFGIPECVHYIPLDIATLFRINEIDPDINREAFAFGSLYQEMVNQKHNALWDAKVIKACYEKLTRGDL